MNIPASVRHRWRQHPLRVISGPATALVGLSPVICTSIGFESHSWRQARGNVSDIGRQHARSIMPNCSYMPN